MPVRTTWRPNNKDHDKPTFKYRNKLPDNVFAFPKQRREPLTDAAHVKEALARFDQVEGVTDKDREVAFANIKKAAKYYGIDVMENDWRELGKQPHTPAPVHP